MEQRNTSIFSTASFVSLWRNRHLTFNLARREVVGRYRGSLMGLAWSFFNPILMLLVYTFFFTIAFNVRWGTTPEASYADFAIILFVGLIVHGLLAECLNRAPTLIINNSNYVKRIVFPLEVLPVVALLSALFHAGISTLVLLAAQLITSGTLTWTAIFFPVVLAPFLLLVLGLAWFLTALGVYVRDVGHVIGVITSILLFMSPVFYPVANLPAKIQPFIMLNPLTFIIEQSREVLLHGQLPDWHGLAVYTLISLGVAWLGLWWFQKLRKGFADVL